MAVGMPEVKGLPAAVDIAKNPLAETHEFKQACSVCYVKTGSQVFSESKSVVIVFKVWSGCFYVCDLHLITNAHTRVQVRACWITLFIRRSINAKRMLCLAESNTHQTKHGSSFGPDQQKPNMLDLITFAKVIFLSAYILLFRSCCICLHINSNFFF